MTSTGRVLALALLANMPAEAATFARDGLAVIMRGDIAAGDVDRFYAAWVPVRPQLLIVESVGGNLVAAIALADYVRKLEIPVEARLCWSACTLVLAAGPHRYAEKGATIGVHLPSTPDGQDEAARISLVWHYRRFGIPEAIIAKMQATPASSMSYLTPADLAAWKVTVKS